MGKHLAVYLLLVAGGNDSPSAADIKQALTDSGLEADDDRINSLMKDLEGKDLNELIAEGSEKLVKAASSGGGGGGGGEAAAAADAPAEKAKEKVEEVDALDGGMDMFGGGGSDY